MNIQKTLKRAKLNTANFCILIKKQFNQFCIISTLYWIGKLYSTDCYGSFSTDKSTKQHYIKIKKSKCSLIYKLTNSAVPAQKL